MLQVEFERVFGILCDDLPKVSHVEIWQDFLKKLEQFIRFLIPLGNQVLIEEASTLRNLLSVLVENELTINQAVIARVKQKLNKIKSLSDHSQFTSLELDSISTFSIEYPSHKQMPFRIGILDEHSLSMQRHTLIFQKAGFTVDSYADLCQAEKAIVKCVPDLLFVQASSITAADYKELAKQLLEFSHTRHIPVLLLAYKEHYSLQESLEDQESIYIIYGPLEANRLVEICARQINQLRIQKRQSQNLKRYNYENVREQQAIDSHAIVSIADAKGCIIHVNEKFSEISGYSRLELLGNNHRLLKSGLHTPAFYEEMWCTILSGNIWHGEICNKRKDGSYYWVKASIIPFLDKHRKPFKYVSYRTDITNIKLAEKKMRLLLESLGEGVIGVNLEYKCTFINSAALKMLGYQQHEILNQDIRPLFCTLNDEEHIIETQDNPLLQTIVDQQTRREELLFCRQDGSWFPVELTVTSHMENGLFHSAQIVFHDISVRKQMERKLLISEERFRRAQNYANIGTWEWNIETNELYWSDRVAPLFGYSENEQETSYEKFINAVHPDDRAAVKHAIKECIDSAKPYFVEHRVVWPDGQIRWVSEHGDVVRNEAGKSIRMLGLVQDINIRKRTEQQLKDSEERLSVAIEGAGDGIWDWNLKTDEMQFSALYEQMLGYVQGELTPIADSWRNSVHPNDINRVKRNLEDYLTGVISKYEIELRLRCKDSSWKWVLCRGKVVNRDRDNKPIRMTGIHTDISVKKKLEKNLLLFRHIFEISKQYIYVTNSEGIMVYINPALEKRLGYSSNEILGRHFTFLLSSSRHNEDIQLIMHEINQNKSWTGNLAIRCKDGGQFISHSNIGSIADQSGKLQSIFNIFIDFSDELKRRKELAEAKELAEHANQAKSEFLSSMSHELRTPMNAILGFAQILEFDDDLNQGQKENSSEIIKAGKHLLQLINEVLDLAKIESGHIDLSLETIPLYETLVECLTLIEPLATSRSITIDNAIDPAIGVRADLVRIKQVLLNLLSNGVKYNREKGKIKISSEPVSDDYIRIKVSDTGRGIPEHRLSELFQPFNRLDAGENGVEGTGIGLSITKKLVEMMNGTIGIESMPEVGTVFWFELPAASVQAGTFGSSYQLTASSKVDSDNMRRRVLCIDDNPINIKLIKKILSHYRHLEVLDAHEPNLGIELALTYQPDLVLLDINMPGMDGYQVLRFLQTYPETQNIPVIAVTASAMKKEIERGFEAGFSSYITKPFEVISFLETIDQILNQA